MRFILGALLSLLASSAVAQQQFDLVCQGTISHAAAGKELESRPWTPHIVVDLTARRFCWRQTNCTELYPIKSIELDKIVFNDGDSYVIPQQINRRTGYLQMHSIDPAIGFVMRSQATCRPAPFSGFGNRLF